MAVYNGSEFLKEQLTSILKQLKKSDEVVIVNDASRDHSGRIIEKMGDKRIRLFHNSVNLGLIKSFEKAISLADGDILFLSDQDDIWMKGKIAKTLEVFNRVKPLVVVSDAILVDARKTPISALAWLLIPRQKNGSCPSREPSRCTMSGWELLVISLVRFSFLRNPWFITVDI